jgi:hypothetical protein
MTDEGTGGDTSYLWVIYAHVMAAALFMTGLWQEKDGGTKARIIVGMSLVTGAVGIKALSSGYASEGLTWQMAFIVEQAVILVVGVLAKQKWAWMWGACGVGVAVLFFIRDLVYLWLILLGLALVGVVIWRLLRQEKK